MSIAWRFVASHLFPSCPGSTGAPMGRPVKPGDDEKRNVGSDALA